jgi:hypothetical protein
MLASKPHQIAAAQRGRIRKRMRQGEKEQTAG